VICLGGSLEAVFGTQLRATRIVQVMGAVATTPAKNPLTQPSSDEFPVGSATDRKVVGISSDAASMIDVMDDLMGCFICLRTSGANPSVVV
jgi:hypothetical protein